MGIFFNKIKSKRSKAFKLTGFDQNNDIDNLVVSTVLIADTFKKANPNTVLVKSDVACCDIIIFSMFVTRYFCLGYIEDKTLLDRFKKEYFSKVLVCTYRLYPSLSKYIKDMFCNRVKVYEKIVITAKDKNINEICNSLIFEFNQMIMSDEQGYSPYDLNGPLVIYDIFYAFTYQVETKTLFENLPNFLEPYYDRICKGTKNADL